MHEMTKLTRFERSGFRITQTILFGKYRILSTLGTGNSSTVYLAEHIRLNVYRAIKCIPKDFSPVSSPVLEATLLKNLNHPGIPIIYDVEEDEHFFYIIEEFIQGQSIDAFVSNQNISQELLLKYGIQLCEILDYLHNLVPYPILYQDLKPEHIIVCQGHLKLIDFGIASFFTGSGENYQIYGTKDFAAPEALAGQPVSPSADIYSLGKVLQYLSRYTAKPCSATFHAIIQKAAALHAADRYETVRLFKEALESELKAACPSVSHLTMKKRISVFGSKPGIGTTHIAVSLVSILNQNGYPCVYFERNGSDRLRSMMMENPFMKERAGVCYYRFFRGIPDYGQGIEAPDPGNTVYVEDFGVYRNDIIELEPENFNIFVLSGSPWDFAQTILAGERLSNSGNTAFICNYNNRAAAKKIASRLGEKIYCFPFDEDAFICTEAKTELFFHALSIERGKKKLLNFKRRQP